MRRSISAAGPEPLFNRRCAGAAGVERVDDVGADFTAALPQQRPDCGNEIRGVRAERVVHPLHGGLRRVRSRPAPPGMRCADDVPVAIVQKNRRTVGRPYADGDRRVVRNDDVGFGTDGQ